MFILDASQQRIPYNIVILGFLKFFGKFIGSSTRKLDSFQIFVIKIGYTVGVAIIESKTCANLI